MRIKKTIAIFKRPVNKLFPIEYTYHDTNQTDKAREQKLRWEAAVIGELKRKYEYYEAGTLANLLTNFHNLKRDYQ